MRDRHGTSGRRRLLVWSVGGLLTPGRRLSVQEQIQAAADRYEADLRAAGARYDAAMTRVLAGLRAREGPLPDREPQAVEPSEPPAKEPIDTALGHTKDLVSVDQELHQVINIKSN